MITDIDPATNAYWIANNWEGKRYDYDLMPDDTIIDLGSYTGEFATNIHNKYGCQVICVEPTSAANHLSVYPWATVINAAASVDNIPMKFGGAFYYTSAYEPGNTEYPCFDVLELLDRPIALMKLNVEGFEYPIMSRIIDSGLHKTIKHFQIQFHKINETSIYLRNQIRQSLIKTHKESWCVPFCWESWELKSC